MYKVNVFYSKKVIGTVRLDPCDGNSRITHLVLDESINGNDVQPLEILKPYADQDQLYTQPPGMMYPIKINITLTVYGWVAKTDADGLLVNNLDKLPIYYLDSNKSRYASKNYYQQCPLR